MSVWTKWHFPALAFLALSSPAADNPAGSRPLKAAVSQQNLQSWSEKKEWPDPRPEVSEKRNKRWLHGDDKDAPPFLTHKLYMMFKGDLDGDTTKRRKSGGNNAHVLED